MYLVSWFFTNFRLGIVHGCVISVMLAGILIVFPLYIFHYRFMIKIDVKCLEFFFEKVTFVLFVYKLKCKGHVTLFLLKPTQYSLLPHN